MGRAKKRSNDPKEENRQKFITGEIDKWSAGEYGYTVNCVAEEGVLMLRFTQPTRRQWTLPGRGDTTERRRILTELAMRNVLDWRTGKLSAPSIAEPGKADSSAAEDGKASGTGMSENALLAGSKAPAPTSGEIWKRYIRGTWPGIPEGFENWGRAEVREYYTAMSPEDKQRAPSPNSLYPVLQAMRRVTAYPAYASDAAVTDMEPGDWIEYTNWRRTDPKGRQPNGEPYSYGTIETDFGRFHSAIRYCRTQYRKWWNGAPDPLEGAVVIRVKANLEEIGEERAPIIAKTLRSMGAWRAEAATMFAGGSGRRIGAIGSDLNGFDGDGLRGTDFEVIDGKLNVTWRAEASKGGGYGRDDETLVASKGVALAYRWLRRFHPNPLGPEHPLIWSPDNPAALVSYAALNKAFKIAWKKAFGEDAPRGLRSTATAARS